MNAEEANVLLDAYEGHWNKRLPQGTRATWLYAFEHHSYRIVVKAIQYLVVRSKYPPSLAEMVEVISMFTDEEARDTKRLDPGVCSTCGGDRMVLYSLRPAEQSAWARERAESGAQKRSKSGASFKPNGSYEEYAPCPDCNATADPSFRRQDGSRFHPPDPGLVRERLTYT